MTSENLEEIKPCGCSKKWPYFDSLDRMRQHFRCTGCGELANVFTYPEVWEGIKTGKYLLVDYYAFLEWAKENKITNI